MYRFNHQKIFFKKTNLKNCDLCLSTIVIQSAGDHKKYLNKVLYTKTSKNALDFIYLNRDHVISKLFKTFFKQF